MMESEQTSQLNEESHEEISKKKYQKLLLTVTGSRGDIQPIITLALRFKEKGYDVRLATHDEYRDLAASVGITDFKGLSGNPSEIMQSPAIKELFQAGNNFKAMQKLVESGKPFFRKNMMEIREATEGIDAIIYNITTSHAVLPLAEQLQIPCFGSYTLPVFPTSEFAPPILGITSTGFGFLNSLIQNTMVWLAGKMIGDDINWWRNECGLKPVPASVTMNLPIPVYHTYSPAIIPKPHDWHETKYVTGWVFPEPTLVNEQDEEEETENKGHTQYNNAWKPSKELKAFLSKNKMDSTKPIVYVGFGSMSMLDNKKIISIVVPAIQQLNYKCILCAGWSDVDSEYFKEAVKSTPDDFICIKYAPHDWLFKNCDYIVHHGGAGTVGASLQAGKPMVVCSVLGDQPFWGKKMIEMKLGWHVPMKELNTTKLVVALKKISTEEVREKSKSMGEVIAKEDGLNAHVDGVISYLEKGNPYIPKTQ